MIPCGKSLKSSTKHKTSVTIINADKGGGIVIFPNEAYNEMGLDIKEDIIEFFFICIDFLIRNGLPPSSAGLIADTLKFDLRHQLFTFNGELYSQTNGISIGAPYSPPLANIYLLNFDLEVSSSPSVIFYRRYIDDVFLILKRDKPVPVSSLESLRLKFGEVKRGNVVTFLDLVIWNSEHSIAYATHFKKLHAFNYIHAAIWHSWATKKGMIHSQFMRIIKTNSNVDIREFFYRITNEKQIYVNENIKNKYKFSYYNPKCIRNLIGELHPGFREIRKGIQRSNAHSWDIRSEKGALQFYDTEQKSKPNKKNIIDGPLSTNTPTILDYFGNQPFLKLNDKQLPNLINTSNRKRFMCIEKKSVDRFQLIMNRSDEIKRTIQVYLNLRPQLNTPSITKKTLINLVKSESAFKKILRQSQTTSTEI
ncbi:hypothetical protein RF11_16041 [Thelohanellus kitauei]|uniref:Reverse transcriptase domain-containing protein n=1 Tax=Thelohanellus kitauei TaxID=669202 RepID=A0A0C2MY79_THEKT|nr:hypothetical protein RF11_16041 [Thelohanellus kitauei]